MNKLLFAALIITVATPTFADEVSDKLREVCNTMNDTAGTIMGNRQDGRSMSDLMKLANGNKIIEELIIAAYDSPRYRTKAHQTKSVEDFKNEVFLDCIKTTKK